MMLKLIFISFVGLAGLFLTGCSNAHPTLSNSSLSSLALFSLDQNSVAISSKSSLSFSLSGRCSLIYTDVKLSFDQGSTWTSLKSLDSSSHINCANTGVFSGTIVSPAGYNAANFTGSIFNVLVKGTSSLGTTSDIQTLLLNFSGKTSIGSLSASASDGFQPSTTNQFLLRGHLKSIPETAINSQSGQFKIMGALSAY